MSRMIVSTPDTCSGEPRIEGTRLTCANVALILTAGGMPIAEFLEAYRYLDVSDIRSCLEYCASRDCIKCHVPNFCHGCSLDKRDQEPCLKPEWSDTAESDEMNNCYDKRHKQQTHEQLSGRELAARSEHRRRRCRSSAPPMDEVSEVVVTLATEEYGEAP